ncbi:MAG: indole-3-glycerol-phosphate synthase, partial [Acidimicrobiales bacterium]
HHRARARADQRDWRQRAGEGHYVGPSFVDALTSGESVAVIAEVKRRSPSRGWIDESLESATLARAYESGGAGAVSVLTDETYFAGSAADLVAAHAAVALPVLRKDFLVAENDVVDAFDMGAAAVLLIVAALSDEELAGLIGLADRLGLATMVEAHDGEEAARALDAGARVIGINQRDLRTFEVDTHRAEDVVGGLPAGVVTVCESGLASRDDVERVAGTGVDAVLVGEAFVTSSDPAATVAQFASVRRRARG